MSRSTKETGDAEKEDSNELKARKTPGITGNLSPGGLGYSTVGDLTERG